MSTNEPSVDVVDPDGALVGPFVPMLRFPQFGRGLWEMSRQFMVSRGLPNTVREVAILVVAAGMDARFETYSHEAVGRNAGLTSEQIASLACGERPDGLDPAQDIAFLTARVVSDGRQLPESTYQLAVAQLGEDGLAELLFLIGSYTALAVVMNGYDIRVPGRG